MKPANKLSQFTQSLSFRSALIAILTLLMIIPLMMVNDTIKERNNRYNNVLHEIASSWGAQQTIIGPILAIPYVEHKMTVNTVTDNSGVSKTISKDVFTEKTMMVLPQELNITAKMNEEYRKRGIYDSLVYNAEVKLEGNFNIGKLIKVCDTNCTIYWEKAWLSVGLTDTKAIIETSRMNWDGSHVGINPGTKLPTLLLNGFHAPILGNVPNSPLPTFKLRLVFNGSKGIRFAPIGEVTKANISSGWPHPSFQGNILPKKQQISDNGFNAKWLIPNLARNYPQHWIVTATENTKQSPYHLEHFTTGVDLFEPVTLYSKISRASKYGILFIALTYITFLIFELTLRTKPHFIQYVLVGLSLSLFYLILVSLAEHIAFLHAYLAASGVTILLITFYSAAILKKKRRAIWIFLLLMGLYGVLYTILHLEDYALLAGSGLLLLVITVLMLATRRIGNSE